MKVLEKGRFEIDWLGMEVFWKTLEDRGVKKISTTIHFKNANRMYGEIRPLSS